MLMRIMVLWGLVTMAMALVRTPPQFYAMRALLGAAEAGFFPGLILYLTYWFPSYRRARITTLFYTGLPIAGVVGGPIAGWIMSRFTNSLGLRGWQWMFLLEGLPAVVLGIAAFYYLDDKPSDASWLSRAEKELIQDDYAADISVREANHHHSFLIALRDPRSYIASCGYFCIICASAAVIYWQPAIIKSLGVVSYWHVGLLSSIPFLAAAVAMLLVGRHSDRMLERRWHLAVPLFVATLCLGLLPLTNQSAFLSILLLSGATAGVYTSLPIFWAIPPAYFSGPATAGSIALVNTLGVLGGAFNANLIGWTKTQTGTLTLGLDITAALLMAGAAVILVAVPARVLRERRETS
jgi:MFS family permease